MTDTLAVATGESTEALDIETTCQEDTIALLLGEVARHDAPRALRILIEHVGMLEVAADLEHQDEDEQCCASARAAGRSEAHNQTGVMLRGLVAGLSGASR